MQTAPLSYQQREMICNIRAHPTVARRYDNVLLYRLDGDIDIGCLVGAIEDLVARHPALRTVVHPVGDGYVQRVCAAEEMKPVSLDPRDDGTIAQLGQSLLDQRYTLDDILQGCPLFRAGIHRRESHLVLSTRIHHLIYDGWSLAVLWRDLSECYAARLEKRAPDLPVLPITYAEIAQRQEQVHARRLEEAVAFYRKVVGDCDGAIHWPPPAEEYCGSPTDAGVLEVPVPESLVPRITEVSRQARVSPFVVLMAATAAGICRVTDARDVLVGADTANRKDAALQDVIGLLLNTRVVRLAAGEHDSLLQLVRSVRDPWMKAADYEDVYYDQVVKALGSPHIVKVNMPNLSANWSTQERPTFPHATVHQVPLDVPWTMWRDMLVIWFLDGRNYRAVLYHRLTAVSRQTAQTFGEEILNVLGSGLLRR